MPLPNDSGELYDLLAGDTTLQSLLGTYHFEGGITSPALTRLWPNEPADQAATCSGVEVAIGRVPASMRRPLHSGEVIGSETLRIIVTQWSIPPEGSHHHAAVIDRILTLLEGQAEATPAGLPEGLTGLAQAVIRYVSPEREVSGAPGE